MVPNPPFADEPPPLQAVLRALDDPDCRTILTTTTEPMTANELATACDIPRSTVYRKLDLLTQAGLVRELIDIGPTGGRISRYERDVTDVQITVDDDTLSLEIHRPARRVEDRLATMWSSMRDEL